MTINDALIDRAAGILYNETHKHGYNNTWTTAHDKSSWRAAVSKMLTEIYQ